MELKISRAETQAAEANTRLAEQILKENARIKDLTETNKRRLKELADQLNQQCRIDQNVINVINDAAKSRREITK